uniref:Uncharacterized protein n=1 Tax=Lates calcarifer TaxID=8187 RepID=A0A4W6FNY5_LATCA
MAEDHGLCNGEASVQIAERCELVLLLLAEHVKLLDGVQRLLLALQPDDVWEHLTLVLGAPVEDRAWCSNDDLLLQLDSSHILTPVASNGVGQFHIWTKFPHLLDDLTNLQSELIRWRDAEALKKTNEF